MNRIPACVLLFLSVAFAFGQQQPQNSPSSATLPVTSPGDATQPQEQPQNQSELREAVRACAALLVAATAACPGDAAQQLAQRQQQPQQQSELREAVRTFAFGQQQPQNSPSSATPPVTSPGDATQPQEQPQNQSELREAVRACAALLVAATAACPGDAAQQLAQRQQQPQHPAKPQNKSEINSGVQSNIANSLSGDPMLSGTDVQVTVDDVSITLTGSVQSEAQLERVVALISPYLRYFKVVNKVTVQ